MRVVLSQPGSRVSFGDTQRSEQRAEVETTIHWVDGQETTVFETITVLVRENDQWKVDPAATRNAFFESVSGFTTTGASILTDVEALPMGLLFWRSATSFIGGVGIILFVLLVLPEKKGVQSSFYRAEVSDLSKMSFRTRSRHIVRIIAIVYFTLIITETILLKLLGMSFFDAVCHSFSTIATSGNRPSPRMLAFSPFSGLLSTELGVTSAPVPEVVGSAITGTPPPGVGAPEKNVEIGSSVPASAPIALPTSMALPPPTATTRSQSPSLSAARPFSTVCSDGSASTCANSTLLRPASDRPPRRS